MFKTPCFRQVTAPYWALTLGLIILSVRPAHSGPAANFGQDGAPPVRTKTTPSSQPAPPSEEPARDGASIKSTTDVVTLTVTVTDRNQRLVTGLDPKNFEVYEDKVKQS